MSYSVDAKRGGGALFDLIHQIDISLWLFGKIKDVSAVLSKRSELSIDGDDVTNLMITHENGVTGHIQVDMASPVYRCEAEIITKDAIYTWSDIGGEVRKQTSEDNLVIEKVPVGFERNDLFLSNMRHWLKRMNDSKIHPLCSFEEGMHALKVAIASQDAYMFKKVISL
jgi:predicted dehydrogenase